MKNFEVTKSAISGTLQLPTSKSHSLRAILFALLANGKSVIEHYLPSPDSFAMIEAIRKLGAKVQIHPDYLEIEGSALTSAEDVIDCGNSGIVLRFIGAIAGLLPTYTILTGDHSIRHNRPVEPLLRALTDLGATALSSRMDNFAPLIIKGPISPGQIIMDGADSQPVSGILLACSFLNGPTEIHVTNPGEKPWIDLTLSWLSKFNIEVTHENYTKYLVKGNASYSGFEYIVPADFSSAAFPLAAAIITGGEVTLKGIDMQDMQGDKELIHTLIAMGANIELEENMLHLRKGSNLKGAEIDINRYIDSITILAIIACFAEGKTIIKNAAIARKKECDRIHAIATELGKMGANIEETEDGLIIEKSELFGASVKSHKDHRVAMSLTVAALMAKGKTTIEDVDCIAKTYPNFKEHMDLLGALIK